MLAAPSTPAHAAGAGAALNIRDGAVAGITGGSAGGRAMMVSFMKKRKKQDRCWLSIGLAAGGGLMRCGGILMAISSGTCLAQL